MILQISIIKRKSQELKKKPSYIFKKFYQESYGGVKHNNCINDPLRHKKLIKNQIKSSKMTYDNTFTNKKPRKN